MESAPRAYRLKASNAYLTFSTATGTSPVDGYELYDHILVGGRNPRRLEALSLTDYALERYALAGNVTDWIERIGALADSGGVNIWFSTQHGGIEAQIHTMKLFAREIMPEFA